MQNYIIIGVLGLIILVILFQSNIFNFESKKEENKLTTSDEDFSSLIDTESNGLSKSDKKKKLFFEFKEYIKNKKEDKLINNMHKLANDLKGKNNYIPKMNLNVKPDATEMLNNNTDLSDTINGIIQNELNNN